MMLQRLAFLLTLTLLIGASPLHAADDPPPGPPPKPYRPFAELNDVLFFEDFENATTLTEKGKLHAETPCAPGGHAWLFENKTDSKTEKTVQAFLNINKTPAKIPGGLNPSQIFVGFNIWAEESGDVIIKGQHKDGGYEDKQPVSKEKTWVPVLMRLSDMRSKNNRVEPEQIITKLEFYFKARPAPKEYPKVYIDDIVISANGIRPLDVMPRVMLARKTILDLTKTPARDGYSYSPQLQDTLKSAIKTSGKKHKLKTVLVAGALPKDDEHLVKGLTSNAAKLKATGFTFLPGESPDEKEVAGLDDMRAFLTYNLQKSDAEMLVLMLGASDAMRPGRPSESLRVVLERALDMGCAPIVCLPASPPGLDKKDKAKVDGFVNTATNVCLGLGVPVVDSNFAVKGAATAFDKQNLNASGIDELAALATQVVKQLDTHVFMRK